MFIKNPEATCVIPSARSAVWQGISTPNPWLERGGEVQRGLDGITCRHGQRSGDVVARMVVSIASRDIQVAYVPGGRIYMKVIKKLIIIVAL